MIHQYKLNGYNIVLDVCSGAIHVVDDVAYDIIAMLAENQVEEDILPAILEKYRGLPDVTEEEVHLCLQDIRALREAGSLFSEDEFEPLAHVPAGREPVVKALCLHVAHSCNLNCSYCFAGQGNYHGGQALMPFEIGKQALDFLIAHSGTRRNLEVDFFGGEPLLNLDVVRRLVAYAREVEKGYGKNFRFTFTTNGVLLDDEAMDFLNREMHNVVLSLDGRREVHDRFRRDHAGNGSYDLVVPKFQRLVEKRGGRGYYVRGTFTHHNTDFVNDILHMADLGFTELSMEPVVCAPDDPCALTEKDLPILFAQYERLAAEMLRRKKEGRGFTFYHYILDLEHGPCIYKRIAGCGSGTEYMAVTPQGELYPCHQFVGEPQYRLGDIRQGVVNTALRDSFRDCSIYSRKECRDCWARFYCAGGCAANAFHASGDIHGVYPYGCELFKKRLECAIMLQIALQDTESV